MCPQWELHSTTDILTCPIVTIYIDITDISIELLGPDPLGAIRDASMKFRCGPLITEAVLSATMEEKVWSGQIYYDVEDEKTAKDEVYLLPLIGKYDVLGCKLSYSRSFF